jgi:hypothetical protein
MYSLWRRLFIQALYRRQNTKQCSREARAKRLIRFSRVAENVPAGDINSYLQTGRNQAPQLVLFMSEQQFYLAKVAGGTTVETEASDVIQAVTVLLN